MIVAFSFVVQNPALFELNVIREIILINNPLKPIQGQKAQTIRQTFSFGKGYEIRLGSQI